MKFMTCRLICFLCLAGMMTTVIASEQRVLLSFDNSGHQVRKIVYPEAQPMLLQPATPDATARQRSQIDVQSLIATLEPGTARLIWKDDDGLVAANTEVPDPRILHAPGHVSGPNKSLLGQKSGAWMVEGPQSATSVMILLPAHLSLGLAFEQWEVLLAL